MKRRGRGSRLGQEGPEASGLARTAVALVLMSFCLPSGVAAQEWLAEGAPGRYEIRVGEDEWTGWILGRWEGTFEGPGGETEELRSFESLAAGQYLISKLARDGYHRFGVLELPGAKVDASGTWFGSFHDRWSGTGRREGPDSYRWWLSNGSTSIEQEIKRVSQDEMTIAYRVVRGSDAQSATVRLRRAPR